MKTANLTISDIRAFNASVWQDEDAMPPYAIAEWLQRTSSTIADIFDKLECAGITIHENQECLGDVANFLESLQVNVEPAFLKEFRDLKKKHPDAVLLFRVGDFYESYEDDADVCARVLGITLTARNNGVRMAGFPHHALDTYLPRLICAGRRVAICDDIKKK